MRQAVARRYRIPGDRRSQAFDDSQLLLRRYPGLLIF